MRDDQTHQPIDERRGEHERHKARLRPAVKNVSGEDEPAISPPLGCTGERVVAQQRKRQEVVDKNVGTENHAGIKGLEAG